MLHGTDVKILTLVIANFVNFMIEVQYHGTQKIDGNNCTKCNHGNKVNLEKTQKFCQPV